MPASPLRVLAAAVAAASTLAAAGLGWELARFGLTDATAIARLERDIRRRFAERARQVEALADRVAEEHAIIAEAATAPERTAPLFDRLTRLARAMELAGVSATATVYVPAGAPGGDRALAWSAGPAENVPADRLAGPRDLFVAQGTVGLRLVFIRPIEVAARRIGVAAVEVVLSPASRVGGAPTYRLDTALCPVTLIPPQWAGGAPSGDTAFLVNAPSGAPLAEVHVSGSELAERRSVFRRRVAAVAVLPLLAAGLLLTGRLLDRRRRVASASAFFGWSAAIGAALAGGAAASVALVRLVSLPDVAASAIGALAALGLAAVGPGSWWWRQRRREGPTARPAVFIAAQLAAGVVLAAVLLGSAYSFEAWITPAWLDTWQFPLFPVDRDGLLFLIGLLLLQIALAWVGATVLATVAVRWGVSWRTPAASLLSCGLWLAPTVAVLVQPHRLQPLSIGALMGAATATAFFALSAAWLRRLYRRTSQAMRLLLVFAALYAPTVVLYPLAASYADRAAGSLVERDYAPTTANHPQDLRAELRRIQQEIDQIGNLQTLATSSAAPPTGPLPTQPAFTVWNQTSLSRRRLTSEIELFGPDLKITSRFALNVPEYRYAASQEAWRGRGCTWDLFGVAGRLGSDERSMLRAERGLCDAEGRLRGAIVVHVVPDYQTLPFVASANPYADLLGGNDRGAQGSRLAGLQLVVYGWSLHPLFAPSGLAWPITEDLFQRLYRSREPFWVRLPAAGRPYQVYFTSDRTNIYALGYPSGTVVDHVMRLAEAAALAAAVFIALLLGAALYAPFSRPERAPLGALVGEIRTSFYRKLFLFFVFAAVGPVLLLALAFGAYMTNRLRIDVESEAAAVVRVARRVYQELSAANDRPGQPAPLPTDDAMVWIHQVIGQDVNLYEGSQLVATSQRALFESGLLPTRTPAAAYRALVLDRLPDVVVPDRLGTFEYLVAAAPVSAPGREGILTVPLALRQREIEREIDQLNRGVLVGAVVVVLFAAGLGASVAGRVSDPVARLSRATRQIAAGRLDVALVAETADELGRLVADFNAMAATLSAQRAELARTNQLKAWAEMARQVAHEIKNPLTPIQLAAEHLQRVHADARRPLGAVFDACLVTILGQVRLLRQIASEFSTFAGEPKARPAATPIAALVAEVVEPYRTGLPSRVRIDTAIAPHLPDVWVDRTLIARALTNLVENAVQAMPAGGSLHVAAGREGSTVTVTLADTGVGMDAAAVERAFDPYFSTKTAGSGLGLANAKRNVELCGGSVALSSAPGRGTTVVVTLPVAGDRGADERA